jgi:hypothetical protein
MTNIALRSIRLDGGTQPRAAIDFNVVQEYGEAIADCALLPPVTVYFDGAEYWLADGFHRWHAHEALGAVEIAADVRQGTQRDAVLFSCSANAAHGMRRTNADKRRAVLRLLDDAEWVLWSDREIARRCGVSPQTVVNIRPKDTVQNGQNEAVPRTFIHPKTGQPAQMNVSRIGSAPRPAAAPEAAWTPSDIPPAPEQSAPAEEPSPRLQQIAEDRANAFISAALWEIERQMATLPGPREAVGRFPTCHYHTLSSATLYRWSEWFAAAAAAWDTSIAGAGNVAAE